MSGAATAVGTGAVAPAERHVGTVARGGALALVGALTNAVGGFALVALAGRLVGVAATGEAFAAIGLFTIVANGCKLGADTGLMRFVARGRELGRPDTVPALVRVAVGPPVVVSVAAGIGFLALAPWIAGLLYAGPASAEHVTLVRTLGVFVPPAAITLVLLAACRGLGVVWPFVSVEQVMKSLARPLLLVAAVGGVAATVGDGALRLLWAWLLPAIVGLPLAVLCYRRVLSRTPGARAGRAAADATAFWRFTGPRAAASLMEITQPWIAVVLLSAMATASDAGAFTAVVRVATAGTMVMLALRLASAPLFAAAWARGARGEVQDLHRACTGWTIAASWPFFALAAVFAPAMLGLFGSGFADGATALAIVSVANLVNTGAGNVQTLVLMAGRSSWNLLDTGVAVATQIALALVLVPHLGLTGAGIAYAGGVVVNNVLATVQVRFGLGVPVWSAGLTRLAAVLGLVALGDLVVARALGADSVPGLLLATALSAGAVVGYAAVRPGDLSLPALTRLGRVAHP